MNHRSPVPTLAMLVVLLADLGFGLWALQYMPEQVPTHFNAAGEADAWGPAWVNALGLGILPWFMMALMWVIPKLDPNGESLTREAVPFRQITWIMIFLGVAIHVSIVAVSLEWIASPMLPLLGAISFMFMFLGNVLGKIPPNYMLGVRTPWTLASEEVWRKTHRTAAWVWVVSGIVQLACLALPENVRFIGWFSSVMLGTLGVVAYSYIVFQKQDGNGSGDTETTDAPDPS